MPHPSLPRTLVGPRRRSVLASAAVLTGLAGCSPGSDDEEGTDAASAAVRRVRARAARDSAGLMERYDATIAAFPALADRLKPLRAEVARHARAFGWEPETAPGTDGTETEKSASPEKSGKNGGPSPSPAAATQKDALAALVTEERALADRRTAALLDVPGEPARLLASVAAAGAAHVYLLTESGNTK